MLGGVLRSEDLLVAVKAEVSEAELEVVEV